MSLAFILRIHVSPNVEISKEKSLRLQYKYILAQERQIDTTSSGRLSNKFLYALISHSTNEYSDTPHRPMRAN